MSQTEKHAHAVVKSIAFLQKIWYLCENLVGFGGKFVLFYFFVKKSAGYFCVKMKLSPPLRPISEIAFQRGYLI
jgi:hypothetical protein